MDLVGVLSWIFQVGTALFQVGTALLVPIFLLIFALYFVPTFVAYVRSHHQLRAIAVLNVFLGWTLIGWVAALVWASTAKLHATAPQESWTAECPVCRSKIHPEATLCPFCRSHLRGSRDDSDVEDAM